MSIVFIMGRNEAEQQRRKERIDDWLYELKRHAPDTVIETWPHISDKNAVEYAVAWDQPENVFNQLPHLKAISSLGAGVNHLIHDPSIAQHIPIVRVIDNKLSRDMTHYVLQTVLNITRLQQSMHEGQQKKEWRQHAPFNLTDDLTVGVMGLGEIGGQIANTLASIGIPVIGWSRRLKALEGVTCYAAEDFDTFLSKANILICILPLNEHTQDIVNSDTLAKLPKNAYVINIARGQHVVDNDLIQAIDSEHIAGAKLDVFREEPLPTTHPFWAHPKIEITPHNAGVTTPQACAKQIIDNYNRLKKGEPLKNFIDKQSGY